MQTIPHKPTTPMTVDAESTNLSQIKILWQSSEPPQNGDSEILSYNVQWDRGLGTNFYELVGGADAYMSLEFVLNEATIFESLTPGHSYQFRYRALNKYGWGPFSDVASFKAAAIPLKADPVTTTIENLYVKIAWEKPNDMSSPIEEYEIAIKQADGVFNSTNG
jgi:hypothetical protein